ncbi:nucleolar protein,nop52 protein [Toxoplasma gondii TgCatPRC2]|uniref:Nucleolar protein,nop52 protein n=1 Tax=Toxoplasma gondii TgCatPRC2 TaxID=1130821 RepID=A0A151HRJ8_TOXGO|nr:nucleolar protein,nop52 protein [Toxoplasma gondii TgCatPRC2]
MVRAGRSHPRPLSTLPYTNGASANLSRVGSSPAPHRSRSASRGDSDERLVAMARLLAHTDVKYRNRGLKRVEAFLSGVSRRRRDKQAEGVCEVNAAERKVASSPLPFSQYEKVWTTLYYAAWLSDKPLVQRELFVCLALLERILPTFAEKRKFFKAFFLVMKSNWDKLDCIRVNKFLLLEKIMVAELMHLSFQVAHRPHKFVYPMGRFLAERILLDERGGNGLAHQLGLYFLLEFREVRARVTASDASVASDQDATDSDDGDDASLTATGEQESSRDALFFAFFFPFFYAACFSQSPAMLRAIHTQVFLELTAEDLRPRLLFAALFALGSQSSVGGENRRMFYRTLDTLEARLDGGERPASLAAVAAASPSIRRLLAQVATLRASSHPVTASLGEGGVKRAQKEGSGRLEEAVAFDDGETSISFPLPTADMEEDCEVSAAFSARREEKRKRESGLGEKMPRERSDDALGLEEAGGDSLVSKRQKKAGAVKTRKQGKTVKDESHGCAALACSEEGFLDAFAPEICDGEQFVGKRKKFLGEASLAAGAALNVRAKKLRAGAFGATGAAGLCLVAAGDERPSAWPGGRERTRRVAGLTGKAGPVGLGGASRVGFLASVGDENDGRDLSCGLPSSMTGTRSPPSPRQSQEKAGKDRKERGADAPACGDRREAGEAQEGGAPSAGKVEGNGDGDEVGRDAKPPQGDVAGDSGRGDSTDGGEGGDWREREERGRGDEEGEEDEKSARKKEKKRRQSEKKRKKEERERRRKERRGLLPTALSAAPGSDQETGDNAPALRAQTKRSLKQARAAGLLSPEEAASPRTAERLVAGKRGSKTGFLVASGASRATERRRVVFDLRRNRVTAFNRLQPPSAVSPSASQADLLASSVRGSPSGSSLSSATSSASAKEASLASASASLSPPSHRGSKALSASGSRSGNQAGEAETREGECEESPVPAPPVLKSILKRPVGFCPALSEQPHWASSSDSVSAGSTPRAVNKTAKKTRAVLSKKASSAGHSGIALALPDGDFHSPSPTAEGLELPVFVASSEKKRNKVGEKRTVELEKKSKRGAEKKTVIALPSGTWDAVSLAQEAIEKREEQ